MTLKVGDVVRLKSGGPNMTVTYTEGSADKVDCTWFNYTGSVFTEHSTALRIAALDVIKKSQP